VTESLRGLGVPNDKVLNVHRTLIWTVIGFVVVEQSLERSVHRRPIDDRGSRYEVVLPFEGPDSIPADLDCDELFGVTIGLALRGLTSSAGDMNR
jgi:hypothetical protein